MPPRPRRDPPYFVLEAHEVQVGDHLDVDWTRHSDWGEEQRLREVRNELIKAKLQAGKTVAYRSSGWSLWPRVASNDLCLYHPVYLDSQVEVDDVVFCHVLPSGLFYAHVVSHKQWAGEEHCYKYWISNTKGRCNGYTYLSRIYGTLYSVLR